MFHKHSWDEVERTYQPPVTRLTKVSGWDEDSINRVLYGFTIVTYKCSCKRRTQDFLLGKVDK